MTKPFLILQLRPETDAADDEYRAILDKGGLHASETVRVRLERESLPEDLPLSRFSGVIVGGGPGCVSDPPEAMSDAEARCEAACKAILPEILQRDFPFLGCCYGMGLLADHLGADVSKERYSEPVSAARVRTTVHGRDDPLLEGLPEAFNVLVGHKEAAQSVPEGATLLVEGEACPVQMIRAKTNVFATQFHPEADAGVFARRIEIYKHHGYFPPETAEALTQAVDAAEVDLAPRILRNFVARYRD